MIPALGSCAARMTSGERRLAERLEQKLDDDYLLWYDVPVGPKQTHPDFVIIHPRRGLLILEVKDWRLDTIKSATRERFEIVPDGQPKVVINPLAQARHCAIQVVDALERDAQLAGRRGAPWQAGLPWAHHHPEDQLPQHEAAPADGQPRGRRIPAARVGDTSGASWCPKKMTEAAGGDHGLFA